MPIYWFEVGERKLLGLKIVSHDGEDLVDSGETSLCSESVEKLCG